MPTAIGTAAVSVRSSGSVFGSPVLQHRRLLPIRRTPNRPTPFPWLSSTPGSPSGPLLHQSSPTLRLEAQSKCSSFLPPSFLQHRQLPPVHGSPPGLPLRGHLRLRAASQAGGGGDLGLLGAGSQPVTARHVSCGAEWAFHGAAGAGVPVLKGGVKGSCRNDT